jgi:hypothetical protein
MQIDPHEKGQGLIEYLLFIVLLVLVIFILYKLLGPVVSNWLNDLLGNL